MADCLCDNLVIDSCPPYASAKSFREYVERDCNNCSGVVPVATTIANLKTAAGIDTCCQEIIINRGDQVIYSIDGGTNWVETGIRRLSHQLNFGSLGLVANTATTPAITTSTAYVTEVPVTFTSNRFTVTEAGTYLYNIVLVVSPNAALALTTVLYEIYLNGAAFSPQIQASPIFVTSSADNCLHTMQGSFRLAANSGLSFRINSGTSFTSSTTSVYIDMFKVSN